MLLTLKALIEVIEKTIDKAIQSSSLSGSRRPHHGDPLAEIGFLGLKILALLKKTATFESLQITEHERGQLLDYQNLIITEQFHRDLLSRLDFIKNDDVIPQSFISIVEEQIEAWVPGASAYFQQKRELKKQIYGYDLFLLYEDLPISDEHLKFIMEANGNKPILIKNSDGNTRIYGSFDGKNWKSTAIKSETLAALKFPDPSEDMVLLNKSAVDESIFQEILSSQGHYAISPELIPQLEALQYEVPENLANMGKSYEWQKQIQDYVASLGLPKDYADLWIAKIRHTLIEEADAFCTACRENRYKKADVDSIVASKQASRMKKASFKIELEERIFRFNTIMASGNTQHPALFPTEHEELKNLHPLMEEMDAYNLIHKLLKKLTEHKELLQKELKDNKIFVSCLESSEQSTMAAQAKRIVDNILNRLLDTPRYDLLLLYTTQEVIEETTLQAFSQKNNGHPILVKMRNSYGIYGRIANGTVWKLTPLDSAVLTTVEFSSTEGTLSLLKKEHISPSIYAEIEYKQGHVPLPKPSDAQERTLTAIAHASETLLNHLDLLNIAERLELQHIVNYLLLYGIQDLLLNTPRGTFSSFIDAVRQHISELYLSGAEQHLQWVNAVAAPYYAQELSKSSVPEGENPEDYYELLYIAAEKGDTQTLLRYLAPNYDKLLLNTLFYEEEIELLANEHMGELAKLYFYTQLKQLLLDKKRDGESEISLNDGSNFLGEVFLLQAKCKGRLAIDLIFWEKEECPWLPLDLPIGKYDLYDSIKKDVSKVLASLSPTELSDYVRDILFGTGWRFRNQDEYRDIDELISNIEIRIKTRQELLSDLKKQIQSTSEKLQNAYELQKKQGETKRFNIIKEYQESASLEAGREKENDAHDSGISQTSNSLAPSVRVRFDPDTLQAVPIEKAPHQEKSLLNPGAMPVVEVDPETAKVLQVLINVHEVEDPRNRDGNTLLHIAARNRQHNVVSLLLQLGLHWGMKNKEDQTVFQYADLDQEHPFYKEVRRVPDVSEVQKELKNFLDNKFKPDLAAWEERATWWLIGTFMEMLHPKIERDDGNKTAGHLEKGYERAERWKSDQELISLIRSTYQSLNNNEEPRLKELKSFLGELLDAIDAKTLVAFNG